MLSNLLSKFHICCQNVVKLKECCQFLLIFTLNTIFLWKKFSVLVCHVRDLVNGSVALKTVFQRHNVYVSVILSVLTMFTQSSNYWKLQSHFTHHSRLCKISS